jgi:hypothetical protein
MNSTSQNPQERHLREMEQARRKVDSRMMSDIE